jgi:hypothetical protein
MMTDGRVIWGRSYVVQLWICGQIGGEGGTEIIGKGTGQKELLVDVRGEKYFMG